ERLDVLAAVAARLERREILGDLLERRERLLEVVEVGLGDGRLQLRRVDEALAVAGLALVRPLAVTAVALLRLVAAAFDRELTPPPAHEAARDRRTATGGTRRLLEDVRHHAGAGADPAGRLLRVLALGALLARARVEALAVQAPRRLLALAVDAALGLVLRPDQLAVLPLLGGALELLGDRDEELDLLLSGGRPRDQQHDG